MYYYYKTNHYRPNTKWKKNNKLLHGLQEQSHDPMHHGKYI